MSDESTAVNEANSIYHMRMTEFLCTTENNLQRPKCSISPINFEDIQNVSFQQPLHHHQTIDQFSSPYLQPLNVLINNYPNNITNELIQQLPKSSSPKLQSKYTKSPIQSTPNRNNLKRVNFHSIIDLAQSSSDLSSNNSNLSLSNTHSYEQSTSSGYVSLSNESANFSSNNFINQLKAMSNSVNNCNNKENMSFYNEFRNHEKRKPRTQISREHRNVLENAYNINKYPDSNEVEYLCNLLGFEENVIRIWFQNKRARDKLHKKSTRMQN